MTSEMELAIYVSEKRSELASVELELDKLEYDGHREFGDPIANPQLWDRLMRRAKELRSMIDDLELERHRRRTSA